MENRENITEDLLQSEPWRMFQESSGRKTFRFEEGGFRVNVIEHRLPLVGAYWYVPRGPILGEGKTEDREQELRDFFAKATERGAGWVRVEPADEEALGVVYGAAGVPVRKAPHDMQPRETLVLDITATEEELLAWMKPKTRYNIRLAERKGVRVFMTHGQEYRDAFCDLVAVTAERDCIAAHPRAYYEAMFRSLPEDMWGLFVAEYADEIVATNLVVFHGATATYLHGASGNRHREAMAPYLLQWEAMREARRRGCVWYDLGGVKTGASQSAGWSGITRFKQGFSPAVAPRAFPGCYDIVLKPIRYGIYRFLTAVKKRAKVRIPS